MGKSSLWHKYIENLIDVMKFVAILTTICVFGLLPFLVSVLLSHMLKNDAIMYVGLILEFVWIPFILTIGKR
jgi:hypothetical protein